MTYLFIGIIIVISIVYIILTPKDLQDTTDMYFGRPNKDMYYPKGCGPL